MKALSVLMNVLIWLLTYVGSWTVSMVVYATLQQILEAGGGNSFTEAVAAGLLVFATVSLPLTAISNGVPEIMGRAPSYLFTPALMAVSVVAVLFLGGVPVGLRLALEAVAFSLLAGFLFIALRKMLWARRQGAGA